MPEHSTKNHCFSLKDAPEEVRALPEPLRSKAIEAANELLTKNGELDRDEALRQAIREAWEYRATRMPHAETSEDE